MNWTYTIRMLRFTIWGLSPKRVFSVLTAYISYYLSFAFSKPVVIGLPFASSIEPTTRCNLKCPECPTGMDLIHRPKGDLPLAEFKKYVDAISSHTSYLTLYLQGEPFLNKSLPEMIQYASKNKIFTNLSTNGHFLSELKAKEIIDAGLKKIIISLDGVNQFSYSQYRQNGSFDSVIRGIKNLVRSRQLLGKKNPLIVIQFIVFRHNENEISQIRDLAKKLGVDKVEIKTAQHYNLKGDNKLVTSIARYNRYTQSTDGNWVLKNYKGKGCLRLWTTSVITWDGKMVACCYDKDAEYAFGNIGNTGLKPVWKSKEFMQFRKVVLTDKKSIKICSNCGEK